MSWLDSLARRAAGGGRQADGFPPGSGAGGFADASGTTRRTALRVAAGTAGAVALSGPLGLLRPSSAGATPLGDCQLSSFKAVYADFQACVKNPLQAFEAANDAIADDEEHLLTQKKPSARKRLKRRIKQATRERERALKDLEFCNVVFAQDRSAGDAKCEAEYPASGGAGGGSGGGSGGKVGCEPGFLLCNDYCCNTANAYCQGCNSKVVCCRIEADCCPSG